MPTIDLELKEYGVIDLLVNELQFFSSTSEARRLVQQGGFKINEEAVKDVKAVVNLKEGMIIRAGKKKIVKIAK